MITKKLIKKISIQIEIIQEITAFLRRAHNGMNTNSMKRNLKSAQRYLGRLQNGTTKSEVGDLIGTQIGLKRLKAKIRNIELKEGRRSPGVTLDWDYGGWKKVRNDIYSQTAWNPTLITILNQAKIQSDFILNPSFQKGNTKFILEGNAILVDIFKSINQVNYSDEAVFEIVENNDINCYLLYPSQLPKLDSNGKPYKTRQVFTRIRVSDVFGNK